MKRTILFVAITSLLNLHCLADDGILHQVLLEGSRASQLGLTDAANEGMVGQKKLAALVTYRPGELLEAIPGVIASQHSGEGKANQFYLRGFNLDHGTDLRTSIDDMPVNQRSHAHGQGWTDLNFLIPELAARIDYRKGPYSASNGDFSSAGSAAITYAQRLSQSIASTGLGQNSYARVLLAGSPEWGDGNFLYAFELLKNDGPFIHADDYKKKNVVLRYSQGYANNGFSLSAMSYSAKWNASDQIPLRAVKDGSLDRFDTIDSSDGGDAQRASLSGVWRRTTSDEASKVSAYMIHNSLKLFSNFTYFLKDPVNGDQFRQADHRLTSGINASQTWHTHFGKNSNDISIGVQLQNDNVFNCLQKTKERQVRSTVRQDHIKEASLGLYLEVGTRWSDYLRSNVGLRHDHYQFNVSSDRLENSGKTSDQLLSPTASLIFTPGAKTEFYVNVGNGFHSNDARAALTNIDPNNLQATEKAQPLIRSRGLELGVRNETFDKHRTTLSIYRLDFDSELKFAGDAGATEAGRASRRVGVEISNSYQATPWLAIDLNAAYSKGRSRGIESTEGSRGIRLIGALERVVQLSATVENLGAWSGSLRIRYLGSRALSEDNTVRAKPSASANTRITYKISPSLKLALDGYNLSNSHAAATEYLYMSRLKNEKLAQQDIHFHPVEPRSFRVAMVKAF